MQRIIDTSKYLTMPITFKGMNRIEKLEIPEEALREILYNAIIHKDYTGVHIQMRVWDDYCEIWNEGELPFGFTPETLLEQHSSRPRNRNIANAFFKAGFIDAWGRGYKKIREGFEGAGLPMPKIENAYGGVKVTFQRNNVNSTQIGSQTHPNGMPEGLSKRLSKELSESAYSIFLMIVSDNHINRKVLAEKTGISTTAVQKHLNKLKDLGVLKRIGSAKYGHWEIIENERNDHR